MRLALLLVAAATLFPRHARSAQTLLSSTAAPGVDSVTVRAFASGTLRAVASGGSAETDNAEGSLGVSIAWPMRTLAAVINVATSGDGISSGVGQSLLSPATGSGLKSGLLDWREYHALNPPLIPFGRLGLHVYLSASSRRWVSPTDSALRDDATVIGVGALLFRQIDAQSGDKENRVSVNLEGGITLRNISGDVAGNQPLRQELLGKPTRWFYGLEAGMTTTVNKIAAAIQMYYFLPRARGIGRWQITTGLSLEADLFSFRSRVQLR